MTDEDRAVAASVDGGALEERSARGRPVPPSPRRARRVGLRLVLQRRLEPDALVPPALPLEPAHAPEPRSGAAPRVGGGLRRRSTPASPRRCWPSSRPRARQRGLLPRLPPLPGAAPGARAAAGDGDGPLRAHPLAAAGLLVRAAEPLRLADSRRAARLRSHRLPHDSLAPQLPALVRRSRRRRLRLRRGHGRVRRTACPGRGATAGRHAAEFEELAASAAVLELEQQLVECAPGVPRAPRRSHRPVQERRPRLSRVRALPRRAPRAARPRLDARAPRPLAPGHPRVRGVPRRDPARGARASTIASSRRAGRRSTCASRTTSPRRSRPTSSSTSCW